MNLQESAFGRLVGVLAAPADTFAAIARRPTFLAPILVILVVFGLSGWAVFQRTDFVDLLAFANETRDMGLSAEQIEGTARVQENFTRLISPANGVFVVVLAVVFAFLYWGALSFLGGELTFPQSLSTYLYGIAPVMLMHLVVVPVVLARDALTAEEVTTQSFLASNLAFLAPEGHTALKAILAGVDFFALWSTILFIIGYRIVAKVSWGVSAGVTLAFFLIGLALRALAAGGF